MQSATCEGQLVRDELERILASASFARSDRVSKLLRFLIERHLENRDDELKESIIGVEVFDRKPDYDPKLDSTVRTEAVRLRARLNKYYATEGSQNPLVIELPKGGYVPRWQPRAAGTTQAARLQPLWLVASLVGLSVIATAGGIYFARTRDATVRLAVIPLANLSGDPANDTFVRGLTDEMIRQASGVPNLTVRSRTSSFALKMPSVREAAKQLDVEYIVEGSVARSGPMVRITAQLVRARDDAPIWTGTFNRQMRNPLEIEQEISRGLVNALQLKLGRGSRRYDTEAYDLYLRARAAESIRSVGDDEVIGLLEQAIRKDPSIAPAYAGLAIAYAFRSFDSPKDPERAQELDKMRVAAERAIQLDPSLADAHSALGAAYARNGQWDLAERSFRRALEIDPSLAITHIVFTRFVLWPLGRMGEAVREARAAAWNDPLSELARSELAEVLLAGGQYDEAAEYCAQLPTDAMFVSEILARARLAQGRAADAIQVMASARTNNWGYLAYAYAKAGRREEAERLAAVAPTRYPNRRGAFQYALVAAGLGDKDGTIEKLQRMADVGPVRMGFTLNSPEFAFVGSDLRVAALRKQVGLPQ